MRDNDRLQFAIETARRAGALAHAQFQRIDALVIESKGHQDMVSNADKETEMLIRDAIAAAWPDDGIVGEEHGRIFGTSGYDWIIDPIDGTANFVAGIPQWCVVIAVTLNGKTVAGAIFEPSSGDMFHAGRGAGAFCNGRPMSVSRSQSLGNGSTGVGFSGRVHALNVVPVVERIVSQGGIFFRNASGALMLAYVAAGRLIGYVEEHMNAWDCLAGLLMVEEAGGVIHQPDPATVIERGCLALAAGPGVYGALEEIARDAFNPG